MGADGQSARSKFLLLSLGNKKGFNDEALFVF